MRVRASSVLSLTAIAAVFVLGSAYLTFAVVKVDWFTGYRTASMELSDAVGLVAHSPVLLSGIKVGEVESISNAPKGVRVQFRVRDEYRIPVDSGVTIEQLSALGESYLEFRSGSGGPYLEDGQQVRATAVQLPVSIPEMADTVTRMLEQFDPQILGRLIDTYAQALAGTQELVPQLAHASDLLAATLLSRAPQIRNLLTNAQVPGPDVAGAGADMAAAGPQWGEFGAKVRGVVESLQHLLDARPVPDAYDTGTGLLPFLGSLTDYVDKIGPDLRTLFPLVQPLMAHGAAALPGVDLSALIAQALRGVSPDGAVRLQIDLSAPAH
ncbi:MULTISPECIES: MlaD family protein [unclassified Nocardia]|uniref:MlaD family protein n=1 Tax=unclassified Nocardia TaxID=2637762 RepID=UPI0030E1CD93